MTTNTVEITDTNFESEVLESAVPVLLDFWGPGCGACRALAPTLEAVADEYKGRVKVGKLDAYANAHSSSRFNVLGLPTLLLFKDGQVREQIVGAVARNVITRAIDRHLG